MNNCNECKPRCGCEKPKCGCGRPILEVTDADDAGTLKFNVNGVTTYYDYTALVRRLETDTSLSADTKARALKFLAERHIDAISAEELGSILHLADLADVSVANVENNSILVYNKNEDCGEGCQSTKSGWQGYNADEHLVDSVNTLMGFDQDGAPKTLNAPAHENQYYSLTWAAQDGLKYTQPREVASAPVDTDGKVHQLYVDPTTHEIVVVRKDAE